MLQAYHWWMAMRNDRFLIMQKTRISTKNRRPKCGFSRVVTIPLSVMLFWPNCGVASITEVDIKEISEHTFALKIDGTTHKENWGPIAVGTTHDVTLELVVQDGVGGDATTLLSANAVSGTETDSCTATREAGTARWKVALKTKKKNNQNKVSQGCRLRFSVKDGWKATGGSPRVRVRGLTDWASINQRVNMMWDPLRLTAGQQVVTVTGNANPTSWTQFVNVTHGTKTVTQNAAKLTVTSNDYVTLKPAEPKKQILSVAGTGTAVATWRRGAPSGMTRIVGGDGVEWVEGTSRNISNGSKFDVELTSPGTLGWGRWNEVINITWDIK